MHKHTPLTNINRIFHETLTSLNILIFKIRIPYLPHSPHYEQQYNIQTGISIRKSLLNPYRFDITYCTEPVTSSLVTPNIQQQVSDTL